MKLTIILLSIFFIGCTNKKTSFHFAIDKSIAEKVKTEIGELDADENRNNRLSDVGHYYVHTKVKYFVNDTLTASYNYEEHVQTYYTEIGNGDTSMLILSFNVWGAYSPFVYFYKDTFSVFYTVYAHENGDFRFAKKKTDTLAEYLNLKPQSYEMILSEKPDLKKKNVIYGYIRVKSEPFLDKRVGLDTFLVNEKSMYFRAVYWDGKYR